MRKLILAGIAILAATTMTSAAVLTVGSTVAAPGASVEIPIVATGGETADGIGLLLLVGNGGPTVGGSDQGPNYPVVTGGNVTWGSAPNQFFNDLGAGAEKWVAGNLLAIPSGTAAVQGQVATFTIQIPAGAAPGLIVPLVLERDNTSVSLGTAIIPSELVAGTLTVIPEPAAALLLGLGGLFLRRRSA